MSFCVSEILFASHCSSQVVRRGGSVFVVFCVFLYSCNLYFVVTRVALARWYVEVAVVLISLYMLVCI